MFKEMTNIEFNGNHRTQSQMTVIDCCHLATTSVSTSYVDRVCWFYIDDCRRRTLDDSLPSYDEAVKVDTDRCQSCIDQPPMYIDAIIDRNHTMDQQSIVII